MRHLGFVLATAGLAACGPDLPAGPVADPVALLRISPTGPQVLFGESTQLTVHAYTRGGRDATIATRWISLDPGVVQVDPSGRVRPLGVVGQGRVVAMLDAADGQAAVADTVTVTADSLVHFNGGSLLSCAPTPARARVVARTPRIWVAVDTANPATTLTETDYTRFATLLDTLVLPSDTSMFGPWTDLDGNGHVLVVFSRLINAMSPPNSDVVVLGLFSSRDLLPQRSLGRFAACPGSFEGEVVYLMAPDPDGTIHGNVRAADIVMRNAGTVTAHEWQHMINFGARVYGIGGDPVEQVWLNEGLSHIAEELLFYRASGLAPEQNLAPAQFPAGSLLDSLYRRGVRPDMYRAAEWWKAPATQSPFDRDDDMATRGSAWQFLRFLADQRPVRAQAAWWRALVRSRTSGLTNLRAAVGDNLAALAHAWAVSAVTDDWAGAGTLPQQPSWQVGAWFARDTLAPLAMEHLRANTPFTVSLDEGGALYATFDVPSTATASTPATLTVQAGGVPAGNAPCPSLVVAPGQGTGTLVLGDGTSVCVARDTVPARYVLVLTSREIETGGQVAVTLGATGIATVPQPAAGRSFAPRAPADPEWAFRAQERALVLAHDRGVATPARGATRELATTPMLLGTLLRLPPAP